MAIFFTWHSSEHTFHLDVKWKPQDESRGAGNTAERSSGGWGKHRMERLLDATNWLFLAQGYHGIYLAGPPGGDDRGSECHNR